MDKEDQDNTELINELKEEREREILERRMTDFYDSRAGYQD